MLWLRSSACVAWRVASTPRSMPFRSLKTCVLRRLPDKPPRLRRCCLRRRLPKLRRYCFLNVRQLPISRRLRPRSKCHGTRTYLLGHHAGVGRVLSAIEFRWCEPWWLCTRRRTDEQCVEFCAFSFVGVADIRSAYPWVDHHLGIK